MGGPEIGLVRGREVSGRSCQNTWGGEAVGKPAKKKGRGEGKLWEVVLI